MVAGRLAVSRFKQLPLLDKLQIGLIDILPMIQEHQIKRSVQLSDHPGGWAVNKCDLL
jgi:hypothetical protein